MRVTQEMLNYISEQRLAGHDDHAIRQELSRNRWDQHLIDQALHQDKTVAPHDPHGSHSKKPASNKLLFILTPIILIVLSLGIFFAWATFLKTTNYGQIFDDMIANSISKEYAHFELELTDNVVTFKGSFDVDYRDVSSIDLTGAGEYTSQDGLIDIALETIMKSDKLYIRYTRYNLSGIPAANNALNTWIEIPTDFKFFPGADFGIANTIIFMAAPNGIIPDGNFSQEQQQEILEFIQNNHLYVTENHRTVTDNGTELFAYDLTSEPSKLLELDDLITKMAGDQGLPTHLIFEESETIKETIFVNKNHNLEKVIDDTGNVTITSYNTPVTIETPLNTITEEEFLEQINDEVFSSVYFQFIEQAVQQ